MKQRDKTNLIPVGPNRETRLSRQLDKREIMETNKDSRVKSHASKVGGTTLIETLYFQIGWTSDRCLRGPRGEGVGMIASF